jgi:hypothetical protein
MEAAVWREVCDLLRTPAKLERDFKESNNALASLETAEALKPSVSNHNMRWNALLTASRRD